VIKHIADHAGSTTVADDVNDHLVVLEHAVLVDAAIDAHGRLVGADDARTCNRTRNRHDFVVKAGFGKTEHSRLPAIGYRRQSPRRNTGNVRHIARPGSPPDGRVVDQPCRKDRAASDWRLPAPPGSCLCPLRCSLAQCESRALHTCRDDESRRRRKRQKLLGQALRAHSSGAIVVHVARVRFPIVAE
jgi:hypothetical protein